MNSCVKGKVGERQAAAFLRSEGFDCRRGQQHCGGADSPDVVGLPGYHVEVKRVERLNLRDATAQAEGDCGGKPWVVLHRWNHGQWLVTVKATEFLKLLREVLPGRTFAELSNQGYRGTGASDSQIAGMIASFPTTPQTTDERPHHD